LHSRRTVPYLIRRWHVSPPSVATAKVGDLEWPEEILHYSANIECSPTSTTLRSHRKKTEWRGNNFDLSMIYSKH
jgi:hypothetical protein